MQVPSLGREDPLEEVTAAHSRLLLWTEAPGGLRVPGVTRVGYNIATKQQHIL